MDTRIQGSQGTGIPGYSDIRVQGTGIPGIPGIPGISVIPGIPGIPGIQDSE